MLLEGRIRDGDTVYVAASCDRLAINGVTLDAEAAE